ncbi:MAG: pilus assembly protein PilP [Nitrospinaceae bacterium]
MSRTEISPEVFTNPLALLYVGMPESQVNLVSRLYEGVFSVRENYQTILRRFERNYSSKKASRALRWFQSAAGLKSVSLKKNFSEKFLSLLRGGHQLLVSYRENRTQEELPSGKRLALIARLARVQGIVEHDFKIMESILRVVAPLNTYFHSLPVEDMVEKMKAELPPYMKTLRVIMLFRIYEGLTMGELKKMVQFYESGAGQWFQRNKNRGERDAQKIMNRKARKRLRSVIQALEEGKQDKALFKEIFPPGLRHLFTRKRDPFEPLLVPGEGLEDLEPEEEDVSDTVVAERFGKELEYLAEIPLEHYQNLRTIDPGLYEDLEFFGQLFRERTELEKLDEEKYKEEIEQYQSLIGQANRLMKEELLTPLQRDLGKLTLVGTISRRGQRVALLETGDGKGHTVRVGTTIGPRFGTVESITEDKITIAERMRDFEGNILFGKRFIEYAEP